VTERTNDELYDLLEDATRLMESATRSIADRAPREDFLRLERAVQALTESVNHPKDGLVIRIDRIENHDIVERVKQLEGQTAALGTLNAADLGKIIAIVAVLLGAFWFVLDLYLAKELAAHVAAGG